MASTNASAMTSASPSPRLWLLACLSAPLWAAGCSKPAPAAAPPEAKPAPVAAAPTPAPAAAAQAATAAAPPAKVAAAKLPKPHVRYDAPIVGTPADWGAIRAAAVAAPDGAPTDRSAEAKQRRRKARRAGFRPQAGSALTQGFRLTYSEPGDDLQRSYQKAFQQERVLETMVAQLNQKLKINGIIDLEMAMCGESNAFYDSGEEEGEDAAARGGKGPAPAPSAAAEADDEGSPGPRITICYELISGFVELFAPTTNDPRELGAQVVGSVYFTLFHEVGHALRDNLDLPVVGREEDAVDQLATLLLLQMGDRGVEAAIAAANAFALEQQDEGDAGLDDLWGDHSLSGQRMFDVLCLIYGSDPKGLAELVGPESVPEERSESCRSDYELILSAWNRLLHPHLVGGGPLAVTIPDLNKVSAAAQAPIEGKPATAPAAGRGAPSATRGGRPQDDDDEGEEAP